jgi:hypothetical protein
VARKHADNDKPELTQEELEAKVTERVRVVQRAQPSRPHRLKHALEPPSGSAGSKEAITLMTDALIENADAFGWDRNNTEVTADNWARIILRATVYGVPYDEYEGEGWAFQEEAVGDPPLCDDCREAMT